MKKIVPSIYKIALLSFCCWGSAVFAAGPSFDCAKARTPVERAVCSSPSAAALDQQLADIYKKNLQQLKGTKRQLLKDTQKGWMKWRDEVYQDCAYKGFPDDNSVCLEQLYQERIATLEGVAFERTGECPQSQRIQINLKGWSAMMLNAKDGDTIAYGLAQMRLMGLDAQERNGNKVFAMRFIPKKFVFDDNTVPLTPGGEQHVIHMKAESETVNGERRWFAFSKVLEPIGSELWCDVGTIYSEPDTLDAECPETVGTTLSFEHIIDPAVFTIHAYSDTQFCNPGGRDEVSAKTTAYWIQVGWKLRRIFQQTLQGSSYNVMMGAVQTTSTVAVSEHLPKTISVTVDETCQPGMAAGNFCNPAATDDEDEDGGGPSRPGSKTHHRYLYVYAGGNYIATPVR